MTDQERQNWLAGKWIVSQPTGDCLFRVRRLLSGGRVESTEYGWTEEHWAQKYADQLNGKSVPVSS